MRAKALAEEREAEAVDKDGCSRHSSGFNCRWPGPSEELSNSEVEQAL
jgi:hypothetical protein